MMNTKKKKGKYTVWQRIKKHPVISKVIVETVITHLLVTAFVGYMNFRYFHEMNEIVISETVRCFFIMPFFLFVMFSAIAIEFNDSYNDTSMQDRIW